MRGSPSPQAAAPDDSGPRTFAGDPSASTSSGISAPGGTRLPAPINVRLPIRAPSCTVLPLPISASAPTTAPCTRQRWPTVAPGPISVTGSSPPCSTEPSCTLAPARTTIRPKSARSTAPYQIEAPASTTTSPTSVAVGAIHASGWTCGERPSKENSGMSRRLSERPEVGLHRLERLARGDEHRVPHRRERRRIGEVQRQDLVDGHPVPDADGERVDPLGGRLLAHDLRAEQPPAAALGDHLQPDRRRAREVAGLGGRVDDGGDERVAGRPGLPGRQPGAGHLGVADLGDRRPDDAGEGGVPAADVHPGHPP